LYADNKQQQQQQQQINNEKNINRSILSPVRNNNNFIQTNSSSKITKQANYTENAILIPTSKTLNNQNEQTTNFINDENNNQLNKK
jgi:hypothetical protein